jgi:hypothetical protein
LQCGGPCPILFFHNPPFHNNNIDPPYNAKLFLGLKMLFPQEILDAIVSEIDDDHWALKQCSLVSRAFLPATRKPLFNDICLFSSLRCETLYNVLIGNPSLGQLYIRVLHLGGPGTCFERLLVNSGPTFAQVLSMLPQLRCIHADTHPNYPVDWASLPEASMSALAQVFKSPSLTEIDLMGMTNISTSFIRSPNLKKLALSYCTYKYEDITTVAGKIGHLDTLKVKDDNNSESSLHLVAHTLQDQTSPLSILKLRELSIHGVQPSLLDTAWNIIATTADSLQVLIWSLGWGLPEGEQPHLLPPTLF